MIVKLCDFDFSAPLLNVYAQIRSEFWKKKVLYLVLAAFIVSNCFLAQEEAQVKWLLSWLSVVVGRDVNIKEKSIRFIQTM